MALKAATVFRDYETDGVPSSGPHRVNKADVRAWSAWLESIVGAFLSSSGVVFTLRSDLYADLAHAAKSLAWVIGDPVSANNGVYMKVGVSGFGSWQRVADLPFSFIVAVDAGAGTANAIQATSEIPVSDSALVWLTVFETNTASPVTVAFNGEAPLAVKTNGGNNVAVGGLVAGMTVMGIRSGSTFRLISDQASAAILAAAEAAADRAENAAALALNNFVSENFVANGIDTDFTLANDPGSPNNMIVVVDGLPMQTPDSFSLVYAGSIAKIRMPEVLPNGTKFNVRYGNVIAVGAPSDGAITTNKLANGATTTAKILDDAVTYAKMQNISATLRLLGRKTAGAGDAEELTAADLRDLFLPAGSVVDSAEAVNTAGTPAVTTTIPLDNTIPQISEGTQVLQVQITPKSATNKLRVRVSGMWTNSSGPATNVWAIFNGGANAIRAAAGYVPVTDALFPFSGEVEYVPGSTTMQTITLRLGKAGGAGSVLYDSVSAGLVFGGAAAVTLTVEEIKA